MRKRFSRTAEVACENAETTEKIFQHLETMISFDSLHGVRKN